MVIRHRQFDDIRLRYGRHADRKQSGFRRVQHIGGRLVNASGSGFALVVIPVLPNETLADLSLNFFASSDSSQNQGDSCESYTAVCGFRAHDWISDSGTISTAALDADVTRLLEFGGLGPYEADPNPAANQVYDGSTLGAQPIEVIKSWDRMMTPPGNPGLGYDGVGSVREGYFMDRWTWSLKGRRYFQYPGWLVMGVFRNDVSAQTDFGASEIDSFNSVQEVLDVVGAGSPDFGDLSASQQKVYELLYGGDTYIEADTWKAEDFRAMVKAQAVIRTPFPARHGGG